MKPLPLSIAALLAATCTFLGAAASAHEGKLTFAPVLEKVTPAVVNIEIVGTRRSAWPRGRTMQSRGSGAGVVIDASEGHVVTNHHVIDGADEITVVLEDRRSFEAELVGSDSATDIALLRIDAEGLQALALGDSEELAVGDFVVAVGNPFELGHTVTSGIVSALGRGGFSRQGYEDFIQTDAAINRGNSGGPLVDLDGRLVGINSSIITPSGANAGVGFAVPSNIVKVVTSQLLEHGEVRRGQLGVMIANLRPEDADALGLDSVSGALVSEVMSDTPADDAGIEPGRRDRQPRRQGSDRQPRPAHPRRARAHRRRSGDRRRPRRQAQDARRGHRRDARPARRHRRRAVAGRRPVAQSLPRS